MSPDGARERAGQQHSSMAPALTSLGGGLCPGTVSRETLSSSKLLLVVAFYHNDRKKIRTRRKLPRSTPCHGWVPVDVVRPQRVNDRFLTAENSLVRRWEFQLEERRHGSYGRKGSPHTLPGTACLGDEMPVLRVGLS